MSGSSTVYGVNLIEFKAYKIKRNSISRLLVLLRLLDVCGANYIRDGFIEDQFILRMHNDALCK